MAVAYRSESAGVANTTSPLTITKPAGTASGDILVVAILNESGGGLSGDWPTLPAGWSFLSTWRGSSGPSNGIFTATKTAGGGEPSSYNFTWTGGIGDLFHYIMVAYSGASGVGPGSTVTDASNSFATSLTVPSITTSVTSMLLLLRTTRGGGTPTTWPGSFTLRGSDSATSVADFLQSSAGSTGTQVVSWPSASSGASSLVALSSVVTVNFAAAVTLPTLKASATSTEQLGTSLGFIPIL